VVWLGLFFIWLSDTQVHAHIQKKSSEESFLHQLWPIVKTNSSLQNHIHASWQLGLRARVAINNTRSVKKRLNAEKPKTTKKQWNARHWPLAWVVLRKRAWTFLKCLRSQSVERIVAGGIFFSLDSELHPHHVSVKSWNLGPRACYTCSPEGLISVRTQFPDVGAAANIGAFQASCLFCRLPTRSSSFRDHVALEEVIQFLSRWRILESGRRAKRRRGKERKGKKEGKRG